MRSWLGGSGSLPWETQNYVQFVTGRAVEEWKLTETELPEQLKTVGAEVQDSCRALAPLVVRAEEFEALAAEVEAEARALRLVRERITICRRDIAKMIATGIEEGVPTQLAGR